jgi:glutamate racemase
MDICKRPIGIFDSGAGGISFLRQAVTELPHEDFIYFGDSGNAPYGTRSLEDIRRLALACAARLEQEGAKVIVVACNTASSAAVADIRANTQLPVVAMEPALKPAMTLVERGGVIVMATPATLRQKMFEEMMAQIGNEERVIRLPVPELVQLVEAGLIRSKECTEAVEHAFGPYKGRDIDAIVLGCTHFLFARQAIRLAAEHMLTGKRLLVDGNAGTLIQLKKVLESRSLLNPGKGKGRIRLTTSSPQKATLALYKRLFETGE